MYRFILPVLATALALAQAPADLFTRAPKSIDDALRERIHEFYQDHVEAKYRAAEALVADDTKDFFYSANKPKYISFEINRIDYSEDFTKAKATIVCEQYVMMPGFVNKPLKVPTASYWKLVDGKWFWYLDQQALRRTPFGTVDPSKGGSAPAPVLPSESEALGMLARVKVDREQVVLDGDKITTVEIASAVPGVVMLSLWGALPEGVEAMFDQLELPAKGKTTLRIRGTGKQKPQGTIQVRVSPTNQIIPIQVSGK